MLPEDIMAEDESLGLYPLGPSFMPVTAAADWNSTGHSGMVETTKGVAGGTQIFADEEAEDAPTSYERRWFGSEWGEWAEVGGGGTASYVNALDTDSFLRTDPVDDYPGGISLMRSIDEETTGTFAWNSGEPMSVLTIKTADTGYQWIRFEIISNALPQLRAWTGTEWEAEIDIQSLINDVFGALDSRISALENA